MPAKAPLMSQKPSLSDTKQHFEIHNTMKRNLFVLTILLAWTAMTANAQTYYRLTSLGSALTALPSDLSKPVIFYLPDAARMAYLTCANAGTANQLSYTTTAPTAGSDVSNMLFTIEPATTANEYYIKAPNGEYISGAITQSSQNDKVATTATTSNAATFNISVASGNLFFLKRSNNTLYLNIQGNAWTGKYINYWNGDGGWSQWNIYVPTVEEYVPVIDTTNYAKFDEGKYYKLYNCNNNAWYMGASTGGELMVMDNTESNMIWWQFQPTGREGCYYVRNATTRQYIQALKTKGANSYISLGDAPVEYYVGKNKKTGNKTEGFYWFSSTNTTDYDKQNSNTLALNKDGASSRVLTWSANGSETNSYWAAVESAYNYDPTPFTPSTGDYLYYIKNANSGKTLTKTAAALSWEAQTMDKNQQWYFRGVSNANGGYQIYSASTLQNVDTLHYVVEQGAKGFCFRHAYSPFEVFAVNGDSAITFEEVRSNFSLSEQIYNMPCGTLTQPRLKSADLRGEGVRTPLVVTDNEITPQGANTVWTKTRPVFIAGSTGTITLNLNQTPGEGVEAHLYFDWNRDGVFESTIPLDASQTITQQLTFPRIGENNAREGQSHMRLRLNSTGLNGSEDDVIGQSIDFIITLTADTTAFTATAIANDSTRGIAVIDGHTATATPKTGCQFICWKEQNKVVSTDAVYPFTLDHDVALTAVFSADPDMLTAVSSATSKAGNSIDITHNGRTILTNADSEVTAIRVYNIHGQLVASSNGASLSLQGCPSGVYIVKAFTANGGTVAKLSIN